MAPRLGTSTRTTARRVAYPALLVGTVALGSEPQGLRWRLHGCTMGETEVTDYIARLREAVRASGLSASAYARTILTRDPRTLRRWLAGDSPIPQAVVQFLTKSAERS